MYEFRNVTQHDIDFIASNVDFKSKQALEICGITDHKQALIAASTSASASFTVVLDGKPIAIFGVSAVSNSTGSAWLVAIGDLPVLPARMIATARKFVRGFSEIFEVLRTIVWEENESHRRWVQWLGFKEVGKLPYGRNGELFHIFVLEN
jgi:hypothetical protein